MKIFKFGGASVKDADGVRNILSVLKHTGFDNTLIVVSAMGKTTNALENVVHSYFENKEQFPKKLEAVRSYHHQIIAGLFSEEKVLVTEKIDSLFDGALGFLFDNAVDNYSLVYDQVVSIGELVSSTIISYYMRHEDIENTWLDARKCVKTDTYYRDANLDWEKTKTEILTMVKGNSTLISQGFIGSAPNGMTTTCLLYTSPSPRDATLSRMPSSA